MRTTILVLVAALAAATGCGPAATEPATGLGVLDLDEARGALTVPPEKESAGALVRLENAAAVGHQRAAWVVAHYLLDLFDAARYEPDPDLRDRSRRLLFEALALEPGDGREVTDTVIEAMLVKVDRVLGGDRLHAGAQAARTLLEFDRQRPARAELFGRMVALKAIARGDGPLRANAMLRLADFCRTAFRDAVTAATPYRPGILTYCLYPLYDSDPEPYFASDPGKRPPEPAWQDLAAGVTALLGEMGETGGRLAPLAAKLATEDLTFVEQKKGLLPTRRAPEELGAPMLAVAGGHADAYEWTPLVLLGDGSKPPAADLAEKLRPIVDADRRKRVALGLSAAAPATTALVGAEVARKSGAGTLELVVGWEQAVRAPQGDYWYKRAKGDKVARLGVLPLALSPPDGAPLALHLVVGPGTWRLVSPSGALPEIPAGAGADPVAGLRAQLARVRAAFPDENGLTIVPEAGASYAQLVAAVAAARHDDKGRPLFRDLALAARAPATTGKPTLADRVTRRAAATVKIEPDALAGRAVAVRLCYQDALDRAPKLAGTLALEVTTVGGVTRAGVTSGPPDKALRACVAQSMNDAMVGASIKTARVVLSVAP